MVVINLLPLYTTYIGVVDMTRPLLLPEPYNGVTGSWPEWLVHFENVAAVNKWESAEEKIKWLRVRLTGKAQTAFMRFPEAVRNNYGECLEALQRRFYPDSKRELYVAELHSRRRQKDEDWASFGDALKVLADKAYADLEEKARERLALNHFLTQIANPQVAFGVKQKRPKTVEEAVISTIELESYIGSSGECFRVSTMVPMADSEQDAAGSATIVAGVTPRAGGNSKDEDGSLTEMLKVVNDRLHRLELLVERERKPGQSANVQQEGKKRAFITCWNCGRKGHIARLCPRRGPEQLQGNFNPSVEMASHSRDNI